MIWILTGIFAVAQLISIFFIISLRKKLKKAEQKEIYYKSRVSAPALHSDNASNNVTTPKNEAQPLVSVPDVESYLAQTRNTAMAAHLEANKDNMPQMQQPQMAQPQTQQPQMAQPYPTQAPAPTPVQAQAAAPAPVQIQAPIPTPVQAQAPAPAPVEVPAPAPIQNNPTVAQQYASAPEQNTPYTNRAQAYAYEEQNSANTVQQNAASEAPKKPGRKPKRQEPLPAIKHEITPQILEKRKLLIQLLHERAALYQPFKTQIQTKAFLKEFNEAYPGYFFNLRQIHQELTSSDELVLALMVNELSIHQICALLETKQRTIWSRRLRIKTHLNLTSNDDIDDWVRNSIENS